MKRRIQNVATLFSGCACVLFAILWLRSYFMLDSLLLPAPPAVPVMEEVFGVTMPRVTRVYDISTFRGSLRILAADQRWPRPMWRASVERFASWSVDSAAAKHLWSALVNLRPGYPRGRFGFRWSVGMGPGFEYTEMSAVWIPLWFLTLLSAIAPALWLLRWRRQRLRDRMNLCPRCGYDLRATPERCPECGMVSDD